MDRAPNSFRLSPFVALVALFSACSPERRPTEPSTPRDRVTSRAVAAHAVRSSCERLDERQRAAAAEFALRMEGLDVRSDLFRRCTQITGGSVGLVASIRSEKPAFRVVFEPNDGSAISSDEIEIGPRAPQDLFVFPPPKNGAPPVTFVKFATHLEPVLLGTPVALQTEEAFSPIVGAPDAGAPNAGAQDAGAPAPRAPFVLTNVVPVRENYRVHFRLPALTWEADVPHGGHRRELLDGVELFTWVDARYERLSNQDLRTSVKEACRPIAPPERAPASALWASAQCERVRGEAVPVVLERIARRCGALAREALAPSIELAKLTKQERDGHELAPGDLALATAKLRAVDPPAACFVDNTTWNSDYTGRSSAFALPKVALAPAWKSGLEALGPWSK